MKKAFTIVELLIIVSILGILAALALPIFENYTTKAREQTAKDNLRTLRDAIQLYAAQHNDIPPGLDESGNLDQLGFIYQLSMTSNLKGETSQTKLPGYDFGPYLSTYPKNIFNNDWVINVLAENEDFPSKAPNLYGYIYKPSTRQIRLDYPGTDSEGVRYYDY
jgi:type II secretory pathway pseudopilin PulG